MSAFFFTPQSIIRFLEPSFFRLLIITHICCDKILLSIFLGGDYSCATFLIVLNISLNISLTFIW